MEERRNVIVLSQELNKLNIAVCQLLLHLTIDHNLFTGFQNAGGGYGGINLQAGDRITITNNVLFASGGVSGSALATSALNAGSVSIKNNVFGEGTGYSVPSMYAQQSGNRSVANGASLGFRDLAARDYFPTAGSPLIDAALSVGSTVDFFGGQTTTDMLGTSRSQGTAPDVGPFEVVAAP